MKRQETYGEKCFQIIYLVKDLYPEYIRNLTTQHWEDKQPSRAWGNYLNRNFTKENIWLANKYIQICSNY